MSGYSTKVFERSGFTLIELMVAMFLSAIVTGAGFALFINSNKIHHASSQTTMVQQTTRTALDIMSNELMMAGFGTMDQSRVADIPDTDDDREKEMAFTAGCLNSATGSDQVQFRSSPGGMVIVAEDTTLENFKNTAGALLNEEQGQDTLLDGMAAVIFDMYRDRIGTCPSLLFDVDENTGDISLSCPLFVQEEGGAHSLIPSGAVVLQQPVYVTYLLENNRLKRCAKVDYAGGPCDGVDVSIYYLASGVADLQFVYYTVDPEKGANDETNGWLLDGGEDSVDQLVRKGIRALKIETLVRSELPNPTISAEDCASGAVRSLYYLGDENRSFNAGCSGHTYVQMSTVVEIPNLFVYSPRS